MLFVWFSVLFTWTTWHSGPVSWQTFMIKTMARNSLTKLSHQMWNVIENYNYMIYNYNVHFLFSDHRQTFTKHHKTSLLKNINFRIVWKDHWLFLCTFKHHFVGLKPFWCQSPLCSWDLNHSGSSLRYVRGT